MLFKSLLLTFLAACVVALVVFAARPEYVGTRAGHADEDYIQSKNCLACHQDHFASWARTYHSRMTQEARPETVQGDFERDNSLEYLNVKARMERRGDKFSMTFNFADGRSQTYSVDRTVGSRRIEQYLTKQPGQYTRLPIAYDLTNRRWMNLNGSFFYPDKDDFFQHQTLWDGNCVFCHNVKAQPHLNTQSKQYNTEVAELGIACGACHGAAAHHAEEAASPLTRTLWHLSEAEPRYIVNPRKLDAERSLQVCGHCHGQRVPQELSRIQEILGRGDPFDAGEDLSKIYKPVQRDTIVGNYSFANRFWADGSPRLTAYEYQGILRSRCFIESKQMTCLTCHTMHGGDPKGQITEENRTNKPCLECHQGLTTTESLTAHTKHTADSTGSSCYNCHMPRVVYGVMSVHPTHDITVPNPEMTATHAVPNACNQCHLDKSVNWAITESKRLWAKRYAAAQVSQDKQFDTAEGVRALFAGDALTRAITAEAMSGNGVSQPDARWAAPYLLAAFEDNYPIVRFFAANGLAKSNARLTKPDYLASPAARQLALNEWRASLASLNSLGLEQAKTLAAALRLNRKDVDIEVGE